jgi:acyl-CoA reductase-like NAD-dependent aldehyde dehydrogenase
MILLGLLYYFGSWIYHVYEPVPTRAPRKFTLSSETFHGGRPINIVEPSTGNEVRDVKVVSFTPDEVDECVRRAKIAQKEWGQTSFAERRAVLRDILNAVVENQDEFCRLSSKETGKTVFEAEMGEVLTTCEKIRYIVNHGEDALRPSHRRVPLLLAVKKAWVEYHPMGVIGIIVPYNFPFHNVLSAVVSSIFAGNAAVVKISEGAVLSKDYLEALIRRVLANRGHNPELVTLVAGYGDTGAALVKCPDVNKILFIGSPATGKKIMSAASENLTPVILELGGKDPLIVYPDTHFEHTMDTIIRASFFNCGQNCISSERIYVHTSIYDKVAAEMQRRANLLRQGPSKLGASADEVVDVGAITMNEQIKIVETLVGDAVEKGAKVLAGGKRDSESKGRYFRPTVLKDVTHEMRIANEEAFGPVMSLIRFKDDEDLISKINSIKYGLGGCIFTKDYKKAVGVARKLNSDMVCMNDFGLYYLIQDTPFGGSGESGFGRFNGPEGKILL